MGSDIVAMAMGSTISTSTVALAVFRVVVYKRVPELTVISIVV